MIKRILNAFLIVCACLSVWAQTGSGTVEDPWQLTETMTAVLDDDGTLKICGTGDMPFRMLNDGYVVHAGVFGPERSIARREVDYGPFFCSQKILLIKSKL